MSEYQVYPGYRDCGVKWLEEIPRSWSVKKLKYFASVFPSNVDKKFVSGEIPVRLCNYTDVYYNNEIIPNAKFMVATATTEQIVKYSLYIGDTIVTKDSEDPADIAVPAYVSEALPGVVCGYHLSVIRPSCPSMSKYVYLLFKAAFVRAYFQTHANGLTRYGISSYALSNVKFPEPGVEEAITIANFLDHETAKIDTLIEKQQQLIKLLKEKRQAVISHAVTKGLNPDAPMKDSGVEWLGEVPAHWASASIKNTCYVNDGNHGEEYPSESDFIEGDAGVPFIRAGDFDDYRISRSNLKHISFVKNTSMRKGNLCENDILFVNRGATIGKLCLITKEFAGSNLNSQIAYIRVDEDVIDFNYLFYFLASTYIQTKIISAIEGGALPQYPLKHILNLDVWHAGLKEQLEISSYLRVQVLKLVQLVQSCEKTIELLQERHTALISAAVTGKIDVRNWQPPKPTSTPSMDA